jgi:hypothetical protein
MGDHGGLRGVGAELIDESGEVSSHELMIDVIDAPAYPPTPCVYLAGKLLGIMRLRVGG